MRLQIKKETINDGLIIGLDISIGEADISEDLGDKSEGLLIY